MQTRSDRARTSVRTTASHTIGIPHFTELLRAVPVDAPAEDYRHAILEENLLGRGTTAGRARTFRHLRELYLLDPRDPRFAALRRLWDRDAAAQPLLAGILAVSRDELLRASWPAVVRATPGSVVTSDDLSHVVSESYAGTLGSATIDKIGRNTGASWTQTGHLIGRTAKTRTKVVAGPAAVAFAAYLGYLDGGRALHVLDNPWSALLDIPRDHHLEALGQAHVAGLLDLQTAGHVTEVKFSFLEGDAR